MKHLSFILFGLGLFCLGTVNGINMAQKEAAKVGSGTYVVNSTNGSTRFMWKVETNLVPEFKIFE